MIVLMIAIAIKKSIVRPTKHHYIDTVTLLQIIKDGEFLIK